VRALAARLAEQAQRLRDQLEADAIAARFGCEPAPHPELAGRIEVTTLDLVLIGTPEEVAAELAEHEDA
jgi:alkanesulfonate monooxygenase SsuD/methylene tetrahydromethanopterin reductase-like flavin-dependent oxidoreductase (luciferase family)